MANWASVAEVLELTGTTVTLAQIAQAQGVIDVFSGVLIGAAANLSDRDLRLLRYATSYQTVWQIAQVDVLSRTDAKRVEQDGAKFETANSDANLLAPLASRCLSQLSWKRARSVRSQPNGEPRFPTIETYQHAWLRDQELGPEITPGWSPL